MTISATAIKLKKQSRILAISFNDGSNFELSFEYLRVYSPSAEVRGHGEGQEVLQWGKKDVNVDSIKPVGHYAIQIVFDDGHDTGLFSWEYLHDIGKHHEANWATYLQRLNDASKSRDPELQIIKLGN